MEEKFGSGRSMLRSDSFRAGCEVPEPSEYAGLIKQNLKLARITMVTGDAGKKANFPYDYCGV